MFLLISRTQKLALARTALGIFGIMSDGHIKTNEPNVYNMFVDFFGVKSQEDIVPILQSIMRLDESQTTSICSSISNHNLKVFRDYMLARIPKCNNGIHVMALALGSFLSSVGFRS